NGFRRRRIRGDEAVEFRIHHSLLLGEVFAQVHLGQDFSGRNGSAVSLPELRISISTRVSAASSCLRQESLSPMPRSKSSSARSSGRSPPSSSRTTVSSSSRDLSKV